MIKLRPLAAVALLAVPAAAQEPDEILQRTTAVTRWADPATRPETREEWLQAMGGAGRLLDGPFAATLHYRSPAAVYGRGARVDILLNRNLQAVLQGRLDTHLRDLEGEGWAPSLFLCEGGTPPEVRAFLLDRYTKDRIRGCLIVGDLPVPWFEMDDDFNSTHSEFPCDLFYMDLTGVFGDQDLDAKYDSHGPGAAGDERPEIFLGRLTAAPLAGSWGTEAALLDNYLRKVHDYRTGRLAAPERALSFQDDDWYTMATYQERAYGAVVRVTDQALTTAAEYKKRLVESYESVLVCSHSSPTVHTFKVPGAATTSVGNTEMWALDPPGLFYNLFACSNARYTSSRYYGGVYIFAPAMGIIAVGSTKTGAMLSFQDYYAPLGQGLWFGEAFRDWFARRHPYSLGDRQWHYGMTLLGDPTLRIWRPSLAVSRQPVPGLAADLGLASHSSLKGQAYALLASLAGTAPGLLLPGIRVPVNQDAATEVFLLLAGSPAFPGGVGVLDAAGGAKARLAVPGPLPPALVGLDLTLAGLLLDPVKGVFLTATAPAAVRL